MDKPTPLHRAGLPAQRALLVLLLCLCSACDQLTTDLEPHPDSIPRDEIIALRRAGGFLPIAADSVSVDTLVASLPLGAAHRVVKFTTTAGSFVRTGTKEVSVYAEREAKRLVARAVLRSPARPATAYLTASVEGGFTAYGLVEFIGAGTR